MGKSNFITKTQRNRNRLIISALIVETIKDVNHSFDKDATVDAFKI